MIVFMRDQWPTRRLLLKERRQFYRRDQSLTTFDNALKPLADKCGFGDSCGSAQTRGADC